MRWKQNAWLPDGTPHRRAIMKADYVSDFTLFINHYLETHPDVVAEQKRGWEQSWNPDAKPAAQQAVKEDEAPNDGYGFYLPAGRDPSH
jgi:hypothetical protein